MLNNFSEHCPKLVVDVIVFDGDLGDLQYVDEAGLELEGEEVWRRGADAVVREDYCWLFKQAQLLLLPSRLGQLGLRQLFLLQDALLLELL